MGKFEIEGYAKRRVKCDLAIVHITFRAVGTRAHEQSKRVMDECDEFIKEISKLAIKPKDIEYADDEAERRIIIRIPFDVRILNRIQSALQRGKYNYTMYVSGDISYRHQLLTELSQEALNNSKDIAEELATTSNKKVEGIESIRKDSWDDCDDRDSRAGDAGAGDILGLGDFYAESRPADDIDAKYIEEEVHLKITWNIA